MGCISFGIDVYQESKRTGKGCLDVCGERYKNCCKCPTSYSPEEYQIMEIGTSMYVSPGDCYDKLGGNKELNMELLKTINEENKKVRDAMKTTLTALLNRANQKVIIGTGNSCNCPCYLYNLDLVQVCPKCGGRVEEDFENGYTVSQKWDEYTNSYKEVKNYNETKICTGFKWNNKIDECDIDLDALFKKFDRTDPEKKVHYTITTQDETTKEKKTEEFDVPCHYMMLEGQRFDFPHGITMAQFFHINNEYFFPKNGPKIYINGFCPEYEHKIVFWYESQQTREELGQSLGYYGYAWRHMVLIYTCNSCGHKYHIAKVSPFAFRDKSKDAK